MYTMPDSELFAVPDKFDPTSDFKSGDNPYLSNG